MTKIIAILLSLLLLSIVYPNTVSDSTSNNFLYVDDDNIEGPWEGTIEHPFQHIQDAVDNSDDGDTAFVYSGIYYETLLVDKSINLIGENKNNTIIHGKHIEDTVWIKNSSILISTFTIISSSKSSFNAGIHITEKQWYYPNDPPHIISDIQITNCVLYNNDAGFRLSNVTDITLSNCVIHSNYGPSIYVSNGSYIDIKNCNISNNGIDLNWSSISGGIVITHSSYNINISKCKVKSNIGSGLTITSPANNIIVYNNIFDSNKARGIRINNINKYLIFNIIIKNNLIINNGMGSYFDTGIFLSDINNDILIENNNISSNNKYGIYLLRSNSVIVNDNNVGYNYGPGFFLSKSSSNTIENNKIFYNSDVGLYLDNSSMNNIIKNNVSNNLNTGLHLDFISQNNNILYNTIFNNNIGILTDFDSSKNKMYYNNISKNKDIGIKIYLSDKNDIIMNNIIDSNYGIYLYVSSYNSISENNYRLSNIHAYFYYSTHNKWVKNYWDDWTRIFPRPILGKVHLFLTFEIPWLNFDWHPATKPYDIY